MATEVGKGIEKSFCFLDQLGELVFHPGRDLSEGPAAPACRRPAGGGFRSVPLSTPFLGRRIVGCASSCLQVKEHSPEVLTASDAITENAKGRKSVSENAEALFFGRKQKKLPMDGKKCFSIGSFWV